MSIKKYSVQIYYSSFCTFEVEANDEGEAILFARRKDINRKELLSNLENWHEADIAKEIINEKVT